MPSNAGPMKELYRFEYTNKFRTSYTGVPTINSGGRTSVELRALLPNNCVGFVNINLTKDNTDAGSVNVLVYR